MKKHLLPERKAVVTNVQIENWKPSDKFYPKWRFEDGAEHKEFWLVRVDVRIGLMRESEITEKFFSEEEANAAAKRYTVGKEVAGKFSLFEMIPQEQRREIIESIINSGSSHGVAAGGASDAESPLAYIVLEEAGINKENFGGLADIVIEALGEQRINCLKDNYSENWEAAAAFEYCWLNIPHSSAAFLAAAHKYHYYISGDDFSAGYYWRDMEVTYHGIEAEAIKALNMRKNAGAKGSEASAKARTKRLNALLEGMELVAGRNPDILRLGPESLAQLGLFEAKNSQPKLWAVGEGQVNEYLGEMRRGEAGESIKTRYLTLFSSKPPKRS